MIAGDNKWMIWVPSRFAQGFFVTTDHTDSRYRTADYWAPADERCTLLNDPDFDMPRPLAAEPALSGQTCVGQTLRTTEIFP